MERVTVEGTVNPCAELRTGERKTVDLDPSWERKIRKGYATIVAHHGDPNDELEKTDEQAKAEHASTGPAEKPSSEKDRAVQPRESAEEIEDPGVDEDDEEDDDDEDDEEDDDDEDDLT